MGTLYKTLCVDFDGVICDHSEGWLGRGVFRDPIPGASAYLHKLKDLGWTIIIFTTRGEVEELTVYLNEHNIPFDHINENPNNPPNTNEGKPIASVYLDDRGLCFRGDWEEAFNSIVNFMPWQSQPD